jgi:hypothetical protein
MQRPEYTIFRAKGQAIHRNCERWLPIPAAGPATVENCQLPRIGEANSIYATRQLRETKLNIWLTQHVARLLRQNYPPFPAPRRVQ